MAAVAPPVGNIAERVALRDLLDTWSDRDRRYGLRREVLRSSEIASARMYRMAEIALLGPDDRPLARAALERANWGFRPRTTTLVREL